MVAVKAEESPLDAAETNRLTRLLEACWVAFDRASEAAGSTPLRTGPRGGGRQVAAMVRHVLDAEAAYLAKLGARFEPPGDDDVGTQMREVRDQFVEVLLARARGGPPLRTPRSVNLWSPRYAVRRSAWHALDHAWEIQDRSS